MAEQSSNRIAVLALGARIFMTKDQEIKRLRDMLTWVTDNTRCLMSRKFISKALRDLDDVKAGLPLKPATVKCGKAANRV